LPKPLHILAKPEDIAKRVIVAGDPARVEQLSKYLEGPKLVNKNRGYLTYTGTYEDVRVTVATHGIGGPSASIVFEELKMLGAKLIVRLGTCGGMVKGQKVGDYVIPTGAAYLPGGTVGTYVPGACMPAVPSFDVLKALVESVEQKGLKYYVGPVISADAFYIEDPDFVKKWVSRGIIAVEMECATLFTLGLLRGFKTGALLIVSDVVLDKVEEMATAEELKEQVEKAAYAVLDAIIKVEV